MYRSLFSRDYFASREQFRRLVGRSGSSAHISYTHPWARGPQGERLTTDVAVFGAKGADRLLIVGSGTHGIEGYCGAGAIAHVLQSGLTDRLPANLQLVLIHALNSYGFAWERRTDEWNVDLNRNFVEFSARVFEANPVYDDIHPHLVPGDLYGPLHEAGDEAIRSLMKRLGADVYHETVSRGQHRYADGLFYGGASPTWSRIWFETMLRYQWMRGKKRVGMIDIHSGLGPCGHGELLLSRDAVEHRRALDWFGEDAETWSKSSKGPVAVDSLGGSIRQPFFRWAHLAEMTVAGLEFGTVPLEVEREALRLDNLLHLHSQPGTPEWSKIKALMRAAFFVETEEWCRQIAEQTLLRVRQAIAGLSRS